MSFGSGIGSGIGSDDCWLHVVSELSCFVGHVEHYILFLFVPDELELDDEPESDDEPELNDEPESDDEPEPNEILSNFYDLFLFLQSVKIRDFYSKGSDYHKKVVNILKTKSCLSVAYKRSYMHLNIQNTPERGKLVNTKKHV